MSDLNIAVLGAGVVGLTTAIELKKQFRNAKIRVIAENQCENTTSFVAAGLFRPGTSFCGPTAEITQKWITDAYCYWDNIRDGPEGVNAGITQVSGYIFSSKHPNIVRNHYIEKLVPLYRQATEQELELCPGCWKHGSFFTTLLVQCTNYLPWATTQLTKANVEIYPGKVDSFRDLVEEKYDVVINCTGLGAKFLCKDHKLVPIRGQVIKVQAPWIKTFFYGDYDTYVIPGFNSVTLGGCRQFDSYDCTINKYDTLSIQERCEGLVPSLKGAKILGQKVGLRPHRDPVRIEREILEFNGGKVRVVHHYGHGGYGVTTGPGTALFAVKLVREILTGNSKL